MADQGGSKPVVKRKVPDSLRFADSDDEVEEKENEEKEEKKLKSSFDVESFKCSICLNIWHDVVCVSPCQHNFCNACFSEWYQRSSTQGGCKCPQCRADIMFASKNHTMASLVEDLLENNPSLKRPKEEVEKMDKVAVVKSSFMKLGDPAGPRGGVSLPGTHRFLSTPVPTTIPRPRPRVSLPATHRFLPGYSTPVSIDDDEDDEDDSTPVSNDDEDDEERESDEEEEEEVPCRQCDANTSTHRCPPGSVHLTCFKCSSRMPERTDLSVPQRCVACRSDCCDAYWRSQNLPNSAGVVGCPSGRLQPVSERIIDSFPPGVHKGNNVEQEFTKQYLTQHGLTVQAVVREWMGKVDRSECPGPSNMQITSTSAICDECSDKAVVHLLDKFRMSIPKNEMPPEAAGRDDCWYGHACRTQRHNVNHAKKLNHMCEPTHRNVVR